MDESVYIYGLIDPRSGLIRYVGQTKTSPKKRLKVHLHQSRYPRNSNLTHKEAWIRGLMIAGLRPTIEVLEVVGPNGDWESREKEWIRKELENGMPLTNLTSGGDHGFCGQHSDEFKRILSKKMMGNKIAVGHVWTDEERVNHLKAMDREKMSKAQEKDFPEFVNERTGQRIPSGRNLAVLCRLMGLTHTSMHCVVHKKRRSHKGWVLAER